MLTPHQFRHLSAKILLDAEPGSFETVRQLLGTKTSRPRSGPMRASTAGVPPAITSGSSKRPSQPKGCRHGDRGDARNERSTGNIRCVARPRCGFLLRIGPRRTAIGWNAAFKAGDPFDDCGPAAHLADRTRQDLRYRYGCFLGFLAAQHPDLLARPPAERLNPRIIAQYVACVASHAAKQQWPVTSTSFVLRSGSFVQPATGHGCWPSPSASQLKHHQDRNGIIW